MTSKDPQSPSDVKGEERRGEERRGEERRGVGRRGEEELKKEEKDISWISRQDKKKNVRERMTEC